MQITYKEVIREKMVSYGSTQVVAKTLDTPPTRGTYPPKRRASEWSDDRVSLKICLEASESATPPYRDSELPLKVPISHNLGV